MGGTKWGHVPNWMLEDPGFLGLSAGGRYAALMLWLTSSRHGNGHVDQRSLTRVMGTPDGFDVMAAMAEVEASGLIRVYPDPSGRAASDAGRLVYEICGYDDDAPNDQVKNRSENKLKRPAGVVGMTAELSGFVRTRLDTSGFVRTRLDTSGQVLTRLDGSASVKTCPDLSLEPEPEPEPEKRGEGYERAGVPVHERPQRAFGTSAHALSEGQQGEPQRQEAAPKAPAHQLPEGAIKLPVYENPAPKGMGPRASAGYDGGNRFMQRWGGDEYQPQPQPDPDRHKATLDAYARRAGYADYEAVARDPRPLPQLAPVLTEDEMMAKWRRKREQAAKHREEHPELYEDEPDAPAAPAAEQYLDALASGVLP